MRFKILRHKQIDIFGVFEDPHDYDPDGNTYYGYEIFQSAKPELLGIESTMIDLKNIFLGHTAYKQLDDYDLVEVELKEV